MGTGATAALGLSSRGKQPADTTLEASPDIALSPAGMLPELQGISQWLNSAPLAIADLKGSVVLVQFWTFACTNCQRTLPDITQWHRQYAAQSIINNIWRTIVNYELGKFSTGFE